MRATKVAGVIFVFFLKLFLKVSGFVPNFDIPVINVTVISGQTAVLPCSIDNLGKSKVIWVDPQKVPLTYEEKRVVDDFRVSLVRPVPKEWNLQVTEVSEEDEGQYMCSVNTLPIKTKLVNLYVKIPPEIQDNLSSHDQTVQEGEFVVLMCNATGTPKPEIIWYQSRSSQDDSVKELVATAKPGSVLSIENISRHCHDVYECVAYNGVPNDVSRIIKITVEFKPLVEIRPKRLGQVLGRETILECSITANPQGITSWEKDGRKLVDMQNREVEAFKEENHVLILTLTISAVEKEDWGIYRCYGSNSLGSDEDYMELYEYIPIKRKPPTTLPNYIALLSPAPQTHPVDPNLPHIKPYPYDINYNHHPYNILGYSESTASSQFKFKLTIWIMSIFISTRPLHLF